MIPVGWRWALALWAYALASFFFDDRVKLVAYRIFESGHPMLFPRSKRWQRRP
jgi:hypothetical protein